MHIIKEQGKRMSEAQPSETAVGNMVRRGEKSFLQIWHLKSGIIQHKAMYLERNILMTRLVVTLYSVVILQCLFSVLKIIREEYAGYVYLRNFKQKVFCTIKIKVVWSSRQLLVKGLPCVRGKKLNFLQVREL